MGGHILLDCSALRKSITIAIMRVCLLLTAGAILGTATQVNADVHSLSGSSVQHLKSMGMKTQDIEKWMGEMMKMSFLEENERIPVIGSSDRVCGEGLRETYTKVLDPRQMDSAVMVFGVLGEDKMSFYSGKT